MNTAYFNRFTLDLANNCVLDCSHSGKCDADVEYWVGQPEVRQQLEALDPDDIRAELKEWGAWDAEELADDNANMMRILWIAACNINEEMKLP